VLNPRAGAVEIRRARLADAQPIAVLCGQLGYPATIQQVVARLKSVSKAKHGACFVAETQELGVIGWGHVGVIPLLEVELRAELLGLVVDERVRRCGAGGKLLETMERWAHQQGCQGMSVRSNVIREQAHGFYLKHGFEHYKTQKAFRKTL
jgi:GNAT superfamily N-acetyltransferase